MYARGVTRYAWALGIVVWLGCGAASEQSPVDASTGASTSTTSTTLDPSSSSTSSTSTAGGTSVGTSSSSGGADAGSTSSTGSPSASSSGGDASSTGVWPEGSAGCGLDPEIPEDFWVLQETEADGVARDYYVRLPENYKRNRPYPVIYQFHGCFSGDNRWQNNHPIHAAAGRDAIVVRGVAIEDCWDFSGQGSAVALFDVMVEEVESRFCADDARRFASGYSSGAFVSHQLSCRRGDMLRGVATLGGGVLGTDCTGQTAAYVVHDVGDPVVPIVHGRNGRNGNLERNACELSTLPFDPDPCVEYEGCDPGFDVVWCQTEGFGHGRRDDYAAPAFWAFFDALEPLR